MKWIQYKLHTTTDAVDFIGELLYEMGIAGFEVADNVPLTPEEEKQMFTDIPAELAPDDGTAVITFYTEAENTEQDLSFYSTGSSLRDETLSPPDKMQTNLSDPEAVIRHILQEIRNSADVWQIDEPVIEYSIQDDSSWKDKWKENFQAFRVSDGLIVKPVWEETPDFATPSDIIIQIDPGSAFGTGTHETTQLCMMALKEHIHENTRLMDVGCGSGILAISALLAGAGQAFCLDIDPSAVESTVSNAALNALGPDRIKAVRANILEEAAEIQKSAAQPFDIVVANILADVIIPLSAVIRPFIKDGGIFISSGILTERADEVKQALIQNRFQILQEHSLGEWAAITARK